MGDLVIAIIAPEPDDSMRLGELVDRAQKVAHDIPDVQVMMTRGDAAETIKFFVQNGALPTDVPPEENDGNLVAHAKRELEIIGEDADTVEMYVGVVRALAKYGHSGGSASVAIPVINQLLQFKTLSPLTDNPDEWNHIEEEVAGNSSLWQSQRNPEAFSHDGGKTFYLLSEGANFENPHPLHGTQKHVKD